MAKPAIGDLPQSGSVVSRWLLDEASGNAIDDVGSNDLTENSTIAAGTGLSTANATFDNSRDYERSDAGDFFNITDAAQSGLDITGGLTISGWLKVESTAGTMGIVGKQNNDVANGNSYLLIITGGSSMYFTNSDGSSTNETSSFVPPTGTWFHVVVVYEPSTRVEIYKDGVSQTTNTTSIVSSLANNAYDFRLGAQYTGGSVTNFYDGLMQDVIIWNTALTDTEVTNLYNAYFATTTATSYAYFM